MALSDKQKRELQSPIPESVITQRSQAGQMLDYVEGWRVIDRLNEIIGNGSWGSELISIEHVATVEQAGDRGPKVSVTYKAIVRLHGEHFEPQTGVGFATSTQKSLGDAHEMAGKSAETDAIKRAAIKLGRHLGLALYEKPVDGGRTHVSGDEEPIVAALDAAKTISEFEAAKATSREMYRRVGKAAQERLFAAIKRAEARMDATKIAD